MNSAAPGETGQRGLLFIVSAPSGTGKTTLVGRLVRSSAGLLKSRSYTSRPAREGERNGVDYNFIDRVEFEERIRAGTFLEWAELFGNFYGTSSEDTEQVLAGGQDLVLVIDVQGARRVRGRGIEHTAIFILPPTAQILEARLRGRSKDSAEQIKRRLEVARDELGDMAAYDYVVVNDEIDPCVARLRAIVDAERARTARMRTAADSIVRTFSEG